MRYFCKIITAEFLCLIIISCLSCQRSTKLVNPNIENIKINVNASKDHDISEIIEVTELIPLETNINALLGSIRLIKKSNHNFFICSNSKLFRFSDKGLLLNSYGAVGKGPGEYLSISDFLVDEQNAVVEILDRKQDIILRYSLDGTFINDIVINMNIIKFAKINNDGYFLYNRGLNNSGKPELDYVLFCTENLIDHPKVKGIISRNGNLDLMSGESPVFNQFDSNTYFQYSLNDTIYQFQNKELRQKIKIDFGNPVPLEKVKETTMDEAFQMINSPNYGFISTCLINSDFISIRFVCNGFGHQYVLNRKSGKKLQFRRLEYDNNYIGFSPALLSADGEFLTLISAPDFLGNEYLKKLLLKFGLQVDPSDNPIIVKFKYLIQ